MRKWFFDSKSESNNPNKAFLFLNCYASLHSNRMHFVQAASPRLNLFIKRSVNLERKRKIKFVWLGEIWVIRLFLIIFYIQQIVILPELLSGFRISILSFFFSFTLLLFGRTDVVKVDMKLLFLKTFLLNLLLQASLILLIIGGGEEDEGSVVFNILRDISLL